MGDHRSTVGRDSKFENGPNSVNELERLMCNSSPDNSMVAWARNNGKGLVRATKEIGGVRFY